MKNIKLIFSFVLLLAVTIGCSIPDGIDQDTSFLNSINPPSNVAALFTITNDNSGNVTITPSAESTGVYDVYFGDATTNAGTVQSGNSIVHKYKEGNYTVKIVAKGLNGVNVDKTYPISVVYRTPANLDVTTSIKVHNVKVKAAALYQVSYLVYFGDVLGEVGTPMAIGQELSHDYVNAGAYSVKVVALSGGVASSIENTNGIQIYDAFQFPVNFEDAKVNYFFGTFGDGQQFAKVANPDASGLNTSATVGKYTSGNQGWSGTYSPLDTPIDFAAGNKLRVWVYNPDPSLIGKKMNVELEAATGGSPANGVAVLKVPFTKSGAWEELVFDFSSIPGFPLTTAKFNQLVLRFDDGHSSGGAIFYIDNIRFTY
jgi:hypothetical protein